MSAKTSKSSEGKRAFLYFLSHVCSKDDMAALDHS